MKLLLEIAFDGRNFCGYQVQDNGRTVQKVLGDASRKLLGFPCDISGCSRTDSGVHARSFFCTVTQKGQQVFPGTIPVSKIPLALCTYLDADIAVKGAWLVPEDFHPRYSATGKTYRYFMRFSPLRNPFSESYAWHVPYGTRQDAFDRMSKSLAYLQGTHDFSSFMAAGSKITDPVRTITDARIWTEDGITVFEVSADGFLYHMVRIIAGTLVRIASGQAEPEDMETILAARDRTAAGPTAPAHGLFLWSVSYPDRVMLQIRGEESSCRI